MSLADFAKVEGEDIVLSPRIAAVLRGQSEFFTTLNAD
jgi:hypothetical protein